MESGGTDSEPYWTADEGVDVPAPGLGGGMGMCVWSTQWHNYPRGQNIT